MRPADLALLRTPGVPTVSPDGRMAVVAVERPDVDADGYRAQLWAVPTDGSTPARPLTSGARDSAPVFSPDGRWLAYLSAAPGGQPQVHLLPTAGGAPRRLTDAPLGAGAPVWSPDSRRLAWVAPVPADGADAGAPRLLTRLRPCADEDADTRDRPGCVFVLDLPEDPDDDAVPLPQPRQLTDGSGGDTDVAWSPDGRVLAFVSARHARADRDLVRDVYLVPAGGGDLRRVTRGRGRCRTPAFDPGGATLLVTARPDLGPEGLDLAGSGPTPCRVPVAGGPLVPLLDPQETHRADETPGTVVVDGATLAGVRRAGAVELLRVPLDGHPPEPLVDGPFTVRGFAAAGGVVVATVAHDRSAGELVAITPGRRRLLTGFGRGLGATGRLHRAAELTADAPEGGQVHGWVTVPGGPGPHPVLLVVSGGGWSLRDDVQVHASAGYAVVQCGPRVSADAALAVLEAALTDHSLDAERVGVLGGGLAGVLTGRTDRFAAAVVERPPAGTLPEDLAAVRTPTLVVSAERDRRCPPEEGQRLFAALQRRGVPSELLLFPGEGLDPTAAHPAAGRPRHRLARLEHLLGWWDRWLPVAEGPGPAGDRGAGREGGGAP